MRGLAVATMMLTANFMGSLTSYVVGVVQVAAQNACALALSLSLSL
jgi:hypothetical protein